MIIDVLDGISVLTSTKLKAQKSMRSSKNKQQVSVSNKFVDAKKNIHFQAILEHKLWEPKKRNPCDAKCLF